MVELLTNIEMANIIFLAIQQYKGNENHIVTDIVRLTVKQILKKDIKIDDIQDVCDTVLECFDLYNAFIQEKNMNLPLINDESYDMIVNVLNNLIGEMINGD